MPAQTKLEREESPALHSGKYAQVINLKLDFLMGGMSEEAIGRLAQEDIKGGRAQTNASKSNAAVTTSES